MKFKDVPMGKYFTMMQDGYYRGFYKIDWCEPHEHELTAKALRTDGRNVVIDPEQEVRYKA